MNVTLNIFSIIAILLLILGFIISMVKFLDYYKLSDLYNLVRDVFLVLTIWLFLDYSGEAYKNIKAYQLEKEQNEILTEQNNRLIRQIKDREFAIQVLSKKLAEK